MVRSFLHTALVLLTALLALNGGLPAADVKSLDEAMKLSAETGKPILLEFGHEDCDFCRQAEKDSEGLTELVTALEPFIHITLIVQEPLGKELARKYEVGTTYPVFIILNNNGEVIRRWVGYTGGAPQLIRTLKEALGDLSTINERVAAYEANPTYNEALFLAGNFADKGEHLKAVHYYREALNLGPKKNYDYAYEVFFNVANAVWKDMLAVDSVFPAADAVINSPFKNNTKIVYMAQMMGKLARKMHFTGRIAKYLDAGMKASSGSSDPKIIEAHKGFRADYALHINNDTTGAINIMKASMPPNWQESRDDFYKFSKWCLERNFNLAEAEKYARKTIDMVYPGRYRAMVLNTVAEICYARGNKTEAINLINLAIDHDPENEFYQSQLRKFEE